VHKSRGIQRTRELADEYCQTAKEAIAFFPESEAKAALEEVLKIVVTRKK
jgi:hexaprenyl-diphosphate synthase